MHSYIAHIHRAPAQHIRTMYPAPDNIHIIPTGQYIPWQPICQSGLASLEVTDELQDGTHIYTTRLTFLTPERIPIPTQPQAYKLTLTDGRTLILGTDQRPHPLHTITDTREDKATGRAAVTNLITHTSPIPPLIIVE